MGKIKIMVWLAAIAVLLVVLVALANTQGLGLVRPAECAGGCGCESQATQADEFSPAGWAVIQQISGPLREQR